MVLKKNNNNDNFNRATELKQFKNKFEGKFNPWRLWPTIYRATWSRIQRSSYNHFAEFTYKNKNCRYLDIGTGSGEYLHMIERKNYYIFSDLNPIAIAETKMKAKKYLLANHWQVKAGTAKQTLKKINKVDHISFIHVLSVLPDPIELMADSLKKLKTGGTVLIYLSRVHSGKPTWWKQYIVSPLYQLFKVRVVNVEKIITAVAKKYKIQHTKIKLKTGNDCYLIKKLN